MKRTIFSLTSLLLALCTASAMAAPLNGKALYQQNCASCHGATGKGGSAPLLAGDASKWNSKTFERAVLKGVDDKNRALKAPMPHWKDGSFVSDQGKAPTRAEVASIQRYLRTIK